MDPWRQPLNLSKQSHKHPTAAKTSFPGLLYVPFTLKDLPLKFLPWSEGVLHLSFLTAQSNGSPSRYTEPATACHPAIQSYPGV